MYKSQLWKEISISAAQTNLHSVHGSILSVCILLLSGMFCFFTEVAFVNYRKSTNVIYQRITSISVNYVTGAIKMRTNINYTLVSMRK